jgi:outer membrane protein OmpA-like peptidoglycan-associated protein
MFATSPWRWCCARAISHAQADYEAIQNLAGMKNYAVEVEVYSDCAGSKDHNVALRQHRADAVLRYLAVHNGPPRKIRGNAMPQSGASDRSSDTSPQAVVNPIEAHPRTAWWHFRPCDCRLKSRRQPEIS